MLYFYWIFSRRFLIRSFSSNHKPYSLSMKIIVRRMPNGHDGFACRFLLSGRKYLSGPSGIKYLAAGPTVEEAVGCLYLLSCSYNQRVWKQLGPAKIRTLKRLQSPDEIGSIIVRAKKSRTGGIPVVVNRDRCWSFV